MYTEKLADSQIYPNVAKKNDCKETEYLCDKPVMRYGISSSSSSISSPQILSPWGVKRI